MEDHLLVMLIHYRCYVTQEFIGFFYTLVTREPENPNRQELPTHGANQCDFPGLSREQGIRCRP